MITITLCNGKIKHFETPDGIDIYCCERCGKKYRFEFNMAKYCTKQIEK